MSSRTLLSISTLLTVLIPGPAEAGRTDLRLQLKARKKQERLDYQICRKDIVAKAARMKGARKAYLKNGLARCRDTFPGAGLLVSCKKAALKKHRKQNKNLQDAVKECRRTYEERVFRPKDPLPFSIEKGLAFFAGAGLNVTRPLKTGRDHLRVDSVVEMAARTGINRGANDFGNYSCTPMEMVFSGTAKPEYLLFGNNPKVFGPLSRLKKKKLIRTLGIRGKAPEPDGTINTPAGWQIMGYKSKGKLTAWLPATYCFFSHKTGPLYEGIKIYYLANAEKRTVTPWFGIAFYRRKAKLSSEDLVSKALDKLGGDYKSFSRKSGVTYLSAGDIDSFDKEGDPYNLCKKPRRHSYVGIIKSRKGGRKPAWIVLANVSNMCRQGDKLAAQLTGH